MVIERKMVKICAFAVTAFILTIKIVMFRRQEDYFGMSVS